MRSKIKSESEINTEVAKIHKEIQPALYEYSPGPKENFTKVESLKSLNSNILKITMQIMDKYPELSEYLEEMPVTIPNEKNPEITFKNLGAYYDSLNLMLNNYIGASQQNKLKLRRCE